MIENQLPPIDMVLHCPRCGWQHIDVADRDTYEKPAALGAAWTNPPHRSHLCLACLHIWRPADVPTNGVLSTRTAGRNDSLPVRHRL